MSQQATSTGDRISDWFWSIIDKLGRSSDDAESLLRDFTDEQLLRFALEHKVASNSLYDDRHVIAMPFQSEDDIVDICYWVVGQGKEFYSMALSNPKILANYPGASFVTTPIYEGLAEEVLLAACRREGSRAQVEVGASTGGTEQIGTRDYAEAHRNER
jgi:hypothetical protein